MYAESVGVGGLLRRLAWVRECARSTSLAVWTLDSVLLLPGVWGCLLMLLEHEPWANLHVDLNSRIRYICGHDQSRIPIVSPGSASRGTGEEERF